MTEPITKEFVKTDGFEKTVVFMMQHMETLWRLMMENKSFRMVLEYDAEALNVNINYYS